MAKRTILDIGDIRTLKAAMNITGPTMGFETALKKKLESDVETGLRVALAQVCSKYFKESGAEAYSKTRIGFTQGGRIRFYSTWPPSIYMELARNPFTGDNYIYPRKGLKNGAMLLAIKVSTINGYDPSKKKQSPLAEKMEDLQNDMKYIMDERVRVGHRIARYRQTIFRMRMLYSEKNNEGLFKMYGEKHVKYLAERRSALANSVAMLYDLKREWNQKDTEYKKKRSEYNSLRRLANKGQDPGRRMENKILGREGYIFVKKAKIPSNRRFMSDTIIHWNREARKIEFKDVFSSTIPKNAILESVWGGVRGRVQLGSLRYDRG